MATFFRHENHPYSPSLSDRGKLRLGKKSDLLTILLEQVKVEKPPIQYHVKVLDGAAIVHLLPTTNATTFEDYANATFIPHMNQNLRTCKRVDVVWDTNISNRKKRGKGIRRKVESRNKIPSNWSDFLRDCLNKQELFAFLTNKMASTERPEGKQLFATAGLFVIARGTSRCMESCDHEEQMPG